MGLLAPSAAICHFEVSCTLPENQLRQLLLERLQNEHFRSIENSADEYSCGWVEFDNYEATDFSDEQGLYREGMVCFALREDRRKIPSALLKREISRLSAEYLAAHPNFNRVPKQEREALRDQASSLLFSRTLPTPAVSDVVWNISTGQLRFTSLSQKRIDTFQGLFHQSFPELRLGLLTPFARASTLTNEAQLERLNNLNQANSDAALEIIEANGWLGEDFLQWLLYRSLNSDSGYMVNCAGPLLAKQPFRAWLDNRLQLIGAGQEGAQKVSVAGPQDHFAEVCAALRNSKKIAEATLHLSVGEEQNWRLTLKGERFSFAGYRTPMNKPETDPSADPAIEAEAAFYTKMAAIEEGEQLFASLLKTFLEHRLSDEWMAETTAMTAWLNAEQER